MEYLAKPKNTFVVYYNCVSQSAKKKNNLVSEEAASSTKYCWQELNTTTTLHLSALTWKSSLCCLFCLWRGWDKNHPQIKDHELEKWEECLHQVRLLPQVEKFKYIGSCLRDKWPLNQKSRLSVYPFFMFLPSSVVMTERAISGIQAKWTELI